jgi:glycine C-acetyltransferase
LHPGHRYVFKHNDVEDCEKQLQRATALIEKQGAGGILVITEGVFGMAGDQGKMKEIAAFKKNYEFRLLVDDAHGFGTLGKTGAGAGKNRDARMISIFTSPRLPNQWRPSALLLPATKK